MNLLSIVFSLLFPYACVGFSVSRFSTKSLNVPRSLNLAHNKLELKMNFFEDAFKFFSNMNKEASARHILISGPDASKKLEVLKAELDGAADITAAFSELASKVTFNS